MDLNLNPKINIEVLGKCLNWLDLNKTYNIVTLKPNKVGTNNILTLSMLLEPNTKYVIIYNFDLNGQDIRIPEDSIIEIDGGDLSNGTLIGNNTIILNTNGVDILKNNITLEGTWNLRLQITDGEDITTNSEGKLRFANYEASESREIGKIYLRKENALSVLDVEDRWFFYKGSDNIVYLFCVIDNIFYNMYFRGGGLVLENNLVTFSAEYDITQLPYIAQEHTLNFSIQNGIYVIELPNGSTITSEELNNTNIYHYTPSYINMVEKNILTQEMLSTPNVKYIVQYKYTLDGNTLVIPDGCILEIDGGNISDGTLIGRNTKLLNPNKVDLHFNTGGTWDYSDYKHVILTEDEYEALTDKQADTIYLIVEE